MKQVSEKLTRYIIKSGAVPPESYSVYQYCFQIGLEMLCSFLVCCILGILLHMVLEFVIFTVIFMLLRTYAGGIHLERFVSCLVCSVSVQTVVLIIYKILYLPLFVSWICIIFCSAAIMKMAPVQCENRELSDHEKVIFKKNTKKIVLSVILFSVVLSFSDLNRLVFLVSLVLLSIMISQYIGTIKYDLE